MQLKRRDLHHKSPHRETNESTLLLLYFTTMNNSNLFYDISLQTIFARGIRSQKRERCERAAREIREEFMRGGPEVKGVVLTMALEIS